MVSEDSAKELICKSLCELERHKWYISENFGKDVGGNLAAMDFLLNHYERWIDSVMANYNHN